MWKLINFTNYGIRMNYLQAAAFTIGCVFTLVLRKKLHETTHFIIASMKSFNSRGGGRLSIFEISFKLYYSILIFIGFGTIFVGLLKLTPSDFQLQDIHVANLYANSKVDCSNPANALLHFTSIEKKLETLSQDDQNLVDYVRVRYLSPPSHRPYPIESTGLAKERNKVVNPFGEFVSKIFDNKTNGTFIDASCSNMTDVLLTSPTLSLEKKFTWQGIVVACNPFTVPSIKVNRRNSWIAGVCLSKRNVAHRMHMTFNSDGHPIADEDVPTSTPRSKPSLFQINKHSSINNRAENVEVQTVPLFSLVAAVGWREVDFLSLEMKGYEMDILKNIPFDKVTFKVMQVGIFTYNEKELAELDEFLEMYDYMLVKDRVQAKYRLYVHMTASDKIYENPSAYATLTS